MQISAHGDDGQAQRLTAVTQVADPYDLCMGVEAGEFAVFGGDMDLDLVAHAQGRFSLDLHASTGKIQAQCGNFPASMMEDDCSFQSHADVVAFLAVRSIVLTHGPCPLLMSSPAALITLVDLTCKAAERRPVPA